LVVDYRKVDAALAAALDEDRDPDERALIVFVHTNHPPDASAASLLDKFGISPGASARQIFTATLSPRAISELSDLPWVRALKLSSKLRLLKKK
jgi:hypothetical protein